MNPKVKKVIDRINNEGAESVLQFFNDDVEQLLKYVMWGGGLEELNINSFEDKNIVYPFLIDNGFDDKVVDDVITTLSSITQDGTDYYYEIRELRDLAEWFKSYSRDASPYDVARGVLSEDYWEPFYFSRRDMDLMRDVYDNLTKENRAYLRSVIVERYGNIEIVVEPNDATETIEKIATQNENGNYVFKITNENVMDLFADDDTMNYLFSGDLEEVESDLMSLYTTSYNSAYSNEYYNKVWEELRGSFIDVDAKPIDFKFGNRYYIKLKVTNVLPQLIKEYITSSYCYDIENIGDYGYLIEEGFSCDAWEKLSFSIYDYPDSTDVRKEINDNLSSYF